jgi:hypothetical protein
MFLKPILALSILAVASCATIAPPAQKGTVDHVVVLWLKRPGNAGDRKAVMQAADELRSIPGIRFLDHGTALPSSRPVVDDSFDVAFVMRFDSAAALQAYETNPVHVKKVETVLKPLAGKILVYDVTR